MPPSSPGAPGAPRRGTGTLPGRRRRSGGVPLRLWAGTVRATPALLVLLVVTVTALTAGPALLGRFGPAALPPETVPRFPATTRLYSAPDDLAARWVRDHPADRRTDLIRDRVLSRPKASWFTDPDPNVVREQARSVTRSASARGEVPVLVPYTIPRRDCDGGSTGGTGDLAAYQGWIEAFARGVGQSSAIVILEPDALAHMGCLDPRQRADRFRALYDAGRALRRYAPAAWVYYDAGNSGWQPARAMADRLDKAGAARYADGIALNVSNFNKTPDEARYALAVLKELGEPRLGAVIDTSRNGAGPTRNRAFCDPPGRKLGTAPTTDTGIDRIDAFLWVKHPGQADGCAAPAGTFLPEQAYRMAR